MTRTESPPRPIDEHLPRIRETPSGRRVARLSDFDGTLAPIVEDPDAAVPTEQNRSAVATLANTPSVTTAVVSGRALTDVRERIAGPAIYAGNHGLELVRTGNDRRPSGRAKAPPALSGSAPSSRPRFAPFRTAGSKTSA